MMRAWHFVGPRLYDGRPVPVDGEWLVHEGPLALCESGLHASEHPFDALTHAAGSTLCEVEIDGELLRDTNKLVATRRRIIRRIDATPLLLDFSRWCALQVVHLWDAPLVVREYLETGRQEIRDAAWDAAWAAARDAAWDAARAAAWAAAWAAARAAAWAAARAAAWAAAWAAAGDAAWAAAWAAAGDAAWDAARAAAWAAAGDAAWDAAWDAQRERFATMVQTAFDGVAKQETRP